jgi:hypothetical protein
MLRTLATDLTGAGDVCRVLAASDASGTAAASKLLPEEELEFVLQDVREEFTFSDQALLMVRGDSAATTRRVIERFNYKSHILAHMRFETAGHVDHDCELQFVVGDRKVSIDVARTDEQ